MSNSLATEKRRRRQFVNRWTVSRCAPVRRQLIESCGQEYRLTSITKRLALLDAVIVRFLILQCVFSDDLGRCD